MAEVQATYFNDPHGFEINWNGASYWIAFERINTMPKLLWWVHHLSGKCWSDMTPYQIHLFIELVTEHNDWAMYEGEG